MTSDRYRIPKLVWFAPRPKPENWLRSDQIREKAPTSVRHQDIEGKSVSENDIVFLQGLMRETEDKQELAIVEEDVKERFYRLASEWRAETAYVSSMTELVMHPKYQSIIGLGPRVLPILFKELQDDPDYWFWALRAITEADPIAPEDAGILVRMTETWLTWAKEHNYL
jgi:hypothetical protein